MAVLTAPARRLAGPGLGVGGGGRDSVERIGWCGLCGVHELRADRGGLVKGEDLAAWVISERPRIGVHQFSLAGLRSC